MLEELSHARQMSKLRGVPVLIPREVKTVPLRMTPEQLLSASLPWEGMDASGTRSPNHMTPRFAMEVFSLEMFTIPLDNLDRPERDVHLLFVTRGTKMLIPPNVSLSVRGPLSLHTPLHLLLRWGAILGPSRTPSLHGQCPL